MLLLVVTALPTFSVKLGIFFFLRLGYLKRWTIEKLTMEGLMFLWKFSLKLKEIFKNCQFMNQRGKIFHNYSLPPKFHQEDWDANSGFLADIYRELLPMGNILSFMQLVKLKTCGGKGLCGNKFLRSTCSELATNPVYFERAKHTYPLQPNDLCWLHLSITSCCIWRIVTSCSS